jgi:MFS family permease
VAVLRPNTRGAQPSAGRRVKEMAPSEFARGWRTVLMASLGVGLGVSGLLTYNAGLFARDLAGAIGLSRTAFGAAFFGSTLAMAAAMPLVGRLVDRFGPRAIAAFGAVMLSVGFLALSQVRSVTLYIIIVVLIGPLTAGSTPVPYTRAVSAAFDRARGLALGLTQVGIGLAAAIVPPVIGLVIARQGWQHGFLALAMLAALGLLPALLGLPGRSPHSGSPGDEDHAAIRASSLFRLQYAAFCTMAFAFAGMLSHFVPMLREAGMPVERAGALAGLIGGSVIVTRILVGWLADRIEPAWLGCASCLVCAVGCALLAFGGPAMAPVGAVALGAAMGAEADLIGILTARHFPIAAYSRAYAAQYGGFMVAAGLSPLWMGLLADRTGGYATALILAAVLLLVPAALFLRLPLIGASAPRLHRP